MPSGRSSRNEQTAVAVRKERLPAPAHLSELERDQWNTLINAMPAEHFGPQHIPILLNHIRTAVYQEMIAARIHQHLEAAEEEGTIGTVKERAQFTNMVNSHLGLGKALKVTATAMRLTHSSSYDREKAIGSKKGPVAEVWDD